MATVNYLNGSERPTAELLDDLFAALDGKLTTLLGGRSFFLAQTAMMPQYLIGKAFFFTAGPAVYAPRVPGYIEDNTASNPVARPYNHAQFDAAQASAQYVPGVLQGVNIQQGGSGYFLNDVLTADGGTLAPGGSAATVLVTQRDGAGKILAASVLTPGSYSVLPTTPNQVNGGHGVRAWLDLYLVQFDLHNKVAPVVSLWPKSSQSLYPYWDANKNYASGQKVNYLNGSVLEVFQALAPNVGVTPVGHSATWQYVGSTSVPTGVGFWEWSLSAHSILYQGRGDKKPVRYYLRDGSTMPEKRFKYAVAEIIIEGVSSVTIEKAWDKYACFRIHNLNQTPATVNFVDGNHTVKLTSYQCVTVRRDWNDATGAYENYRPGYNYFFRFEGGDPRFYWFFPNNNGSFGYGGGPAANSMQANNLTNPAILYDWVSQLQRPVNGSTTFAGWNDDPTVQCDIYPLLQKLFGDPASQTTLVGDLIHHKGDLAILRRPKKIWRLASSFGVVVQQGGKGYAAGDFLNPPDGLAIRKSSIQVLAVDAQGGILAAVTANSYDGYIQPPKFYSQVQADPSAPTISNGSGAILGLQYGRVANDLVGALSPFGSGSLYGTKDKVSFNGYATLVADFAAKQLSVTENSAGNLVIASTDPANDVFLLPISTNLLKTGEAVPSVVDLSGTNSFTIENAIFESDPENPVFANDGSGSTVGKLTATAPQLIQTPAETVATPQKTWTDIYDLITLPVAHGAGNPPAGYSYIATDGVNVYFQRDPIPVNGTPQTTLDWTPVRATAKTFNGLHKNTVADLLTLDWWGDPTVPGQNSKNVLLSNRVLSFGPHGLVLTFTETDSAYPGDVVGQSASLPSWASGKRGIPRQRCIRFRAQGWGFVGVAHGLQQAVPPSGTSGIFSPTQGRQSAVGGYSGDIAAPNGADFSLAWTYGKPTDIAILTRIEPLNMQLVGGRFWKLPGDNTWGFVFPAGYPPLAASGQGVVPYIPGQSYLPVMAMDLVVEMYNALARVVNSVTTGTPLMWQCLFFNVGGNIVNLDPNYGIPGSGGIPGPATGLNGYGHSAYSGPRPMNQFGAFDQGSLYHALCNQVGLTVRTEKDFPGGVDGSGLLMKFDEFKNKITAPAVWCDFYEAAGDVAAIPFSNVPVPFGGYANPFRVPGQESYRYDKIADITVAITSTYTNTVTPELLSTAALLAGQPTGAHCLGTYDRTQALPDFTNAPVGSYYVANDGSGYVVRAAGELYVLGPDFPSPLGVLSAILQPAFLAGQFYSSPKGAASYPGNEVYISAGLGMVGGLNLNAFAGYRWVVVEDVRALVTSYGFPFLWAEICMPLVLKYFEDPTKQIIVAGDASATNQESGQFAGESGQWVDGYGGPVVSPELYTPHPVVPPDRKKIAGVFFGASGLPGFGTLIKFCASNVRSAAWKIAVVAAPTTPGLNAPTSGLGGGLGYPVEVANLSSRQNYSPFFRVIVGGGTMGIDNHTPDFIYSWDDDSYVTNHRTDLGITWYEWNGDPNQFGPFSPGYGRLSAVTRYPKLLITYEPKIGVDAAGLFETNYNEGSLLDQRQTLGFNIYSTQPIAALPVLLSGVAAWAKQTDWWSLLDNAYADQGYQGGMYYGALSHSNVPWMFLPPPQSQVQYVTEYFNGSNQNGLTIVSAAPGQRFWCCFSPVQFDLNAVTFASQTATF